MPDNGLNDHARNGCSQPEQRQITYIGAECLQYAAGVASLQGKAKLYPQKAEAHVKYLPETHSWLLKDAAFCHILSSLVHWFIGSLVHWSAPLGLVRHPPRQVCALTNELMNQLTKLKQFTARGGERNLQPCFNIICAVFIPA